MDPSEVPARASFRHFHPIETRWMDNDVYGHVNNVTYYSYFDTVVNRYLIDRGLLDIHSSEAFGVVVETSCRFLGSVAFPEPLEVGLKVARLGNSSVSYELGIFRQGADEVSAHGRFVHVYVDRETRRPTPVPQAVREALAALQ